MSSPAGSPAERTLDPRALTALAKSRDFSVEAVRLLLRMKEVILLAKGLALGQWRESRDPVANTFAEHRQTEVENAGFRETLDIIRGRILRMPPGERKRYSPEERFRIVVFARTYSLSNREAAEAFMVDPQTIARWKEEATREPDRETVGSLLKATPHVPSFEDVTRHLVSLLDQMRVGGSRKIAEMLVRAGRKLSHETVRRYRKNKPPMKAVIQDWPPKSIEPPRSVEPQVLRAKEPNHIWMTDITDVPSFLRIWIFKLVVVLDVYSRFPLAFRVFPKEPASEEIAELLQEAVARYGKPRHFVTDQGAQFTGEAFTGKLQALGIQQRLGAIGRTGSIAIIERFWRTLKEMLALKVRRPLSPRHLEEKVELGLFYYATLRPHQGLAGATPAEIYFKLTPASAHAVSPPRARARSPVEPAVALHLRVAYAGGNRGLPFLTPITHAA